MINIITNGIVKAFSMISEAAKSILDFKSFINTIKTIITFFPPLFTVACICGLTFLVGMAVKRIFF